MTASELPATGVTVPVAALGGPPPSDGKRRGDPVIVLTYSHSGVRRLQALLGSHPSLACTSGTGLLPLCDQAAEAWRKVEGQRGGPLSPLATASVRALASGMTSALLARTGKQRWCETAIAHRRGAETFLQLFPDTRFLCLHRACPDVIYAALRASPWGVSGPGFATFTAAHPGSTVAALAAYWSAHAAPLLAFEQAHPDACQRIRYEDLAEKPGQMAAGVRDFLGLDDAAVPTQPGGDDPAAAPSGADAPGCGADLPVGQIPLPLLEQVNGLHAKLAYPPLEPPS